MTAAQKQIQDMESVIGHLNRRIALLEALVLQVASPDWLRISSMEREEAVKKSGIKP